MIIVMTSYNRPEYLKPCLESLGKSVFFEPTKLIITDDHSTDTKVKVILEEFKHRQITNLDVNVRYRSENLGCDLSVLESISNGFEQTDSDWLVVQDSDAIFNRLWLFALSATIKFFRTYGNFTHFAASVWHNRHAPIIQSEIGQYDIRFGLNGFNLLIHRHIFQQLVHGSHN